MPPKRLLVVRNLSDHTQRMDDEERYAHRGNDRYGHGEGDLSARVPADIPPGERHLVVMIDEHPAASRLRPYAELPVFDLGPWPEQLSPRREVLYGDSGR